MSLGLNELRIIKDHTSWSLLESRVFLNLFLNFTLSFIYHSLLHLLFYLSTFLHHSAYNELLPWTLGASLIWRLEDFALYLSSWLQKAQIIYISINLASSRKWVFTYIGNQHLHSMVYKLDLSLKWMQSCHVISSTNYILQMVITQVWQHHPKSYNHKNNKLKWETVNTQFLPKKACYPW